MRETCRRWWRRALLCWVLMPLLGWAQAPLHFERAELLETPGLGYTPPPYEAHDTELTGVWTKVVLPHAPIRQTLPATPPDNSPLPRTVTSWYRLQLPDLGASADPHYLYLARWKTDGQLAVYGDGRLLYQSHASIFWNGWNIPLLIPLDETADAVPPRVILMRIERPHDSGGGISTVWIGDEDSISWRYHLRYLLQVQLPYISSAAFLGAGLFSLLVWFRQRGDTLYWLFFCVSLASFLRTLHYHVGKNRLLVPDEWFSWLTVNSLFWLIAMVHLFLNSLHRRPLRWLNRTVLAMTVGASVVTLPLTTSLPSVYLLSPLAYVFLMVMGTTVGVVGLIQSRRTSSQDGQLLSGWCLIGMVFWLYDWMLQTNRIDIEGIYLGPYTNLVAFLLFLSIMFRRYIGALDGIQNANASLAERLRAREAELRESHRVQRDIAHRQTLADERQRMMQDMHDGMGSSLRTALLAIEKGQLDANNVADVIRGCIDDLKLAIDAMEPLQADLLLLLATLRYRLGPRLESAGIALRWEVQSVPELEWLDPRNALHILRIVQESLTNIIKHTQASVIRVKTHVEGPHVLISVIDNGHGFDTAQGLVGGGKGMSNQRRRADSIGARIDWQSTPQGTCVTVLLPITRPTNPLDGANTAGTVKVDLGVVYS